MAVAFDCIFLQVTVGGFALRITKCSRAPHGIHMPDVHLLPKARELWSRPVLIELSLIIAGAALIGAIVAAAMNG